MNRSVEELKENILGTMSTAPPDPEPVPAGEMRNLSLDANSPAAAEMIVSLPMEMRFGVCHRQYRGFWQAEFVLNGMAAAGTCLEPNPSDILLTSFPKSGTTWLKALAFAALNRSEHSPTNSQHPLNHCNPHDCVGFLELMISQGTRARDLLEALPSPRLLATHIPYSLLPSRISAEGSGCRIIYVCRDPKDVLVSYWNFNIKAAPILSSAGDGRESSGLATFEEAFELFCEGRFPGGPHWLHALEYWRESQRRPKEVLFLRYEDMLRDPVGNLRELAAFMGCAFSGEEEEAGVVEHIVKLCSLENLKGMNVNKNGSTVLGVKNEVFFRKGQAGDWRNYMTADMAAGLDKIADEAVRGSGLTFGDSISM